MEKKELEKNLKNHFWGIFTIFLLILNNAVQFWELRSGSQGMSLSFFIIITLYNVLVFLLTLQSFRTMKDIPIKYLIFQSAFSIFISLCYVGILCFSTYKWNKNDSVTIGIALIEIIIVGLIGKKKNINLYNDPKIKTILAILFKPVPQLLWAWQIFYYGAKNLSGFATITGNIMIGIQLYFCITSLRTSPNDKNRIWQTVAMLANFISWSFISFAWLRWQIF